VAPALMVMVLAAGLGGPAWMAVAPQDQRGLGLTSFEVESQFSHHAAGDAVGRCRRATADSPAMSGCFHRPHTLEEDNATLTDTFRLRLFSSSARAAVTFKAGAVRPRAVSTNGSIAADCSRRMSDCQSCTRERRRNGDGRPGSGEHGIAVDDKDKCLADRQRQRRRTNPEIHQGRQVSACRLARAA